MCEHGECGNGDGGGGGGNVDGGGNVPGRLGTTNRGWEQSAGGVGPCVSAGCGVRMVRALGGIATWSAMHWGKARDLRVSGWRSPLE